MVELSNSTTEPLPKYLGAIREFPSPNSMTDIRSWFGLVNQVANYAQLHDIMAPFKPFLSARCQFLWSPKLEEAYQSSKGCHSHSHSPRSRNLRHAAMNLPPFQLVSACHWLLPSSTALQLPLGHPGVLLWGMEDHPTRFSLSALNSFGAIEGEALAISWGLKQT